MVTKAKKKGSSNHHKGTERTSETSMENTEDKSGLQVEVEKKPTDIKQKKSPRRRRARGSKVGLWRKRSAKVALFSDHDYGELKKKTKTNLTETINPKNLNNKDKRLKRREKSSGRLKP